MDTWPTPAAGRTHLIAVVPPAQTNPEFITPVYSSHPTRPTPISYSFDGHFLASDLSLDSFVSSGFRFR